MHPSSHPPELAKVEQMRVSRPSSLRGSMFATRSTTAETIEASRICSAAARGSSSKVTYAKGVGV